VAEADSFNKEVIDSHVKSLEQFIDRINGAELYPLVSNDDTDKIRTTRFSLFDISLLDNSARRDSILCKEKDFVDAIEKWNGKIDLSDEQSWIEVFSTAIYDSKRLNLTLKMTMEEFKPGYWRWAIADVKGLGNSIIRGSKDPLPICPIDHEFYFMNMSHFFDVNRKHICRTISSKVSVDHLSFFMGLVQGGALRYDECERIVFHTRQVPGWEICVEEVNRIESSNSGWLITDLFKTDHH
jgi:hypothetical protein